MKLPNAQLNLWEQLTFLDFFFCFRNILFTFKKIYDVSVCYGWALVFGYWSSACLSGYLEHDLGLISGGAANSRISLAKIYYCGKFNFVYWLFASPIVSYYGQFNFEYWLFASSMVSCLIIPGIFLVSSSFISISFGARICGCGFSKRW